MNRKYDIKIQEELIAQSGNEYKPEEYTSFIFDYNPDMIVHLDLNGKFVNCNPATEKILGSAREAIIGSDFFPFIHPEDIVLTSLNLQRGINGETKEYDIRLIDKNNEIIYGHVTCIPIINDSNVIGVYAIVKNMSDKMLIQKELEDSELKYRSIVENSSLGVYIAVEGYFMYTNNQLNTILGYHSLTKLSVWERIHPDDRERVSKAIKLLDLGQSEKNLICRAIKKDGSIIDIEVHFSRIIYKGNLALLGTVLDITEKQKLYEQNEFLAHHDALTGLPNRRMLEKELQKQLFNTHHFQQQFAVMALDLDRFKYINDSLGHLAGDELLQMVAKRWKNCLPEDAFVARIGGDEFFIILPNVKSLEYVEGVAKTILQQMKESFYYNDYEFTVTASIGITQSPQQGKDALTLIKNADVAMYQAKENGKNAYQIFSSSMNERTIKTFVMENDLRQAIRNQQFEVYLQPRVDCLGNIQSAEALIRWNHPQKGFISPNEFIPIAEETGLIYTIGNWVMETVCRLNRDKLSQGLPMVPISVNLSAKQFVQDDFVKNVIRVLEETGLDPKYLEIEITESSFILNEKRVQQALRELKDLGVKVELDDFGTGFSSLSYLTKFKNLISTLKIDRSFFTKFNEEDRSIVSMILNLAHALNMKVVAEGIETKEQLEFLIEEDCDEVQGFLFSKPVAFDEFVILLNRGKLDY